MTIAEAVRAAIDEWLAAGMSATDAHERAETLASDAAIDHLIELGYEMDEESLEWITLGERP